MNKYLRCENLALLPKKASINKVGGFSNSTMLVIDVLQ